ncbi:hypothetical protein EK21DRAFT_110097 [Setomelanomma holmii]|uniref:F-box domain-containing protein n=1 Tax=Setomelanomma holmii TaxID=210430 RepID=A0A9P4HD02_9PLEO|nr:hypothetical protein EK21DRAFT_110097 [Setomelanomma holmii]
MADLPKEIYLEIFSHLPQRPLRVVSQTCRTFANLAKSLMFETLVFHGDAQKGSYHVEDGALNVWYPGRSKTVELASLSTSIDEVIALDIARYTRCLKFGPRIYVEGFWHRYRQWVENQIHQEIDIHNFDDEEDFEDDEEFGYAGDRRIDAERRARAGQERTVVEAAERIWADKLAAQCSNADANLAALTRLFRHMPRLERIEITKWSCDLADFGFENGYDSEVGEQFASCKTTWTHLELLSGSLDASHAHIKHLTLPAIDPLSLTTNSSLEALFARLITLSFNIEDILFLTRTSSTRATALIKLIQRASHTLQTIDFRNNTTSHPQLPETDEHFLEQLFQAADADAQEQATPLVFPQLKRLRLRSIILNTPSLIDFLSEQPVLESVKFEYVYLATTGYKWGDVAKALPPTCRKFYVNYCGHELYRPDSPIAYNHIIEFKPYQEPLPISTSWQTNDAILEERWNDISRQEALVWPLPPGSFRQNEQSKSKEEWIKEQRNLTWREAEFERI